MDRKSVSRATRCTQPSDDVPVDRMGPHAFRRSILQRRRATRHRIPSNRVGTGTPANETPWPSCPTISARRLPNRFDVVVVGGDDALQPSSSCAFTSSLRVQAGHHSPTSLQADARARMVYYLGGTVSRHARRCDHPKPLECNQCGQTFTRLKNLARHQTVKHPAAPRQSGGGAAAAAAAPGTIHLTGEPWRILPPIFPSSRRNKIKSAHGSIVATVFTIATISPWRQYRFQRPRVYGPGLVCQQRQSPRVGG